MPDARLSSALGTARWANQLLWRAHRRRRDRGGGAMNAAWWFSGALAIGSNATAFGMPGYSSPNGFFNPALAFGEHAFASTTAIRLSTRANLAMAMAVKVWHCCRRWNIQCGNRFGRKPRRGNVAGMVTSRPHFRRRHAEASNGNVNKAIAGGRTQLPTLTKEEPEYRDGVSAIGHTGAEASYGSNRASRTTRNRINGTAW